MARPRSQEARQKAFDAASEVLALDGVPGFTIDAVVARSGVAKTTIYRNWSSANELLMDVIQCVASEFPTPDTGTLRGDLLELHATAEALLSDAGMTTMMLDLKARASRDPDLAEMRIALEDERMKPLRHVLERARERGELTTDASIEILCDIVSGPIIVRKLFRGTAITPGESEIIVDTILGGLEAK